MSGPYPLLISIPHGGEKIPGEVEGKLNLGIRELIEDSDAFTKAIYDIGETALKVIHFDILRAVVDPNRSPDDLPPGNPDGVVKSHTCYNKKIYRDDYHKDAHLIDLLLTKYYQDYHIRIQKEIKRGDIEIAFDCHSMASVAPDIAPDPGKRRPMVTLGNNHEKACDIATTEKLARSFMEVFGLDENDVTINNPFAGGYITRKYGNQPIPWIQIEMNRGLYLDERWYNTSKIEMNESRLKVINARFKRVVELFFKKSGH
jgi:N-formylglutamate deformylase